MCQVPGPIVQSPAPHGMFELVKMWQVPGPIGRTPWCGTTNTLFGFQGKQDTPQKRMSHPKTIQGSTDSETRAVTPTRPSVTPTCGFSRLSAGTHGGRVLATTKNCTDTRWTLKKTQIGVTQACATDNRQTRHKSRIAKLRVHFRPSRTRF